MPVVFERADEGIGGCRKTGSDTASMIAAMITSVQAESVLHQMFLRYLPYHREMTFQELKGVSHLSTTELAAVLQHEWFEMTHDGDALKYKPSQKAFEFIVSVFYLAYQTPDIPTDEVVSAVHLHGTLDYRVPKNAADGRPVTIPVK